MSEDQAYNLVDIYGCIRNCICMGSRHSVEDSSLYECFYDVYKI